MRAVEDAAAPAGSEQEKEVQAAVRLTAAGCRAGNRRPAQACEDGTNGAGRPEGCPRRHQER